MKKQEIEAKSMIFLHFLKQGIEMDRFFFIKKYQTINKKRGTNGSQLKRMKSFFCQLFCLCPVKFKALRFVMYSKS